MSVSAITVRPFPDFVGGDTNLAWLPDFPGYYANSSEGNIYNAKGNVLRYSWDRRITLFLNTKRFKTGVHIQVLTAFVKKIDGDDITVDHIDPARGDWYALKNLRWATKKEQRANQMPSKPLKNNKKAIVVTKNGISTKHDSIKIWLESIGLPPSKVDTVATRIKQGKLYDNNAIKW